MEEFIGVEVGAFCHVNSYPDPAVGDAWNPVFKLDFPIMNHLEIGLMGRPYIVQWKMNVK